MIRHKVKHQDIDQWASSDLFSEKACGGVFNMPAFSFSEKNAGIKTWEFLNLMATCPSYLFSERNEKPYPMMLPPTDEDESCLQPSTVWGGVFNMPAFSFSEKTLATKPGNSSISWLHAYHTYVAKEMNNHISSFKFHGVGMNSVK